MTRALELPERITSLPVLLRAFVAGDAARVAELCGDPAVALATATIPHPYPDGTAAAWIATHDAERDAGMGWTYAIERASDATLVGAIDLRVSPEPHGNVGYWVGRPYWGCGYATAATRALIAVAFARLDAETLEAAHLARNLASGRVLEKCGMTLARQAWKPHRGGPAETSCIWSLTRERWEALRAAP